MGYFIYYLLFILGPRFLHEQREVNGVATWKERIVMVTRELKVRTHDYVMGVGPGVTGQHVVHVR